MPLTRAHLLTMDILGQDSLKFLHSQRDDDSTFSLDDTFETAHDISSAEDAPLSSTLKENVPPTRATKRMSNKSELKIMLK